MVELERDGISLCVVPDSGAAVLGLWRDGTPVLHPSRNGGEADPTASACFPMVPWCNRLSAGAVATAERSLVVKANWPTTAFPVHGHGWLLPWQVLSSDQGSVTMHQHLENPAGYCYHTQLRIELGKNVARFDLSVSNTGDRSLPFGIGLHPYFPRGPSTHLQLAANRMTRFDDLGLPLPAEAVGAFLDFRQPTALAQYDHSALYLDATRACVTGNLNPVTLQTGGAFRHLQLWAPEGREYFCIEPLSHRVDDFSRRDTAAPHDLPPGGHMSGWMSLTIEDH